MANADFSRQQNQPTGGFDASSYRAAAPAEEEVRLTPFQQKLAGLEKALPAALSKQAVAAALCIVVMLACFFGFGGAKLRAKYDTVKNGFTTGVAADSGYTLNEELTTRLNTAANIITTASNTLGADSAEVQTAQAALDSFSACLGAVQSDGRIHAPDSLSVYTGGRMHMLYQSNETLGAAIGQLYAKLQEQAADPMKMGAVQGQYSQFNGAQTIISNLHYNDAVQGYQKDVGGFPASVLGKLWNLTAPSAPVTISDVPTSDPDYGVIAAVVEAGMIELKDPTSAIAQGTLYNAGVTSSESAKRTAFLPDATIDRDEMGHIALLSCGVPYNETLGTQPKFDDASQIESVYKSNVGASAYFGFVTAKTGNSYLPKEKTTLEDLIRIVERISDFSNK